MGSILIVTRHTPLPWDDGAGAYLHDIARFLGHAGFRVDVLWLSPHDRLRSGKIWCLPAAFDPIVRLHLPGAIRCGRHYCFTDTVWDTVRARAIHQLRKLLAFIGLNLRRHSES